MHGTAVICKILQIGTKTSECTVSIQHVRNIGSICGQILPARPNSDTLQLRPSLDPRCHSFGPKLDPFGATSVQVHIADPIRNPQNARFHYFPRFLLSIQLGAILLPKGPKLRHFGRDLDFHVHGPSWAKMGPLAQAGPNANEFCGLNAIR